MCDYSLHSIKSRPAKVGDKLTTRDFGTGTRGFAASEDPSVAVCVLRGTELAFAHEVKPCQLDCGRGTTTVQSSKRQRSFGKSTKTRSPPITMRWNFQTARSCS